MTTVQDMLAGIRRVRATRLRCAWMRGVIAAMIAVVLLGIGAGIGGCSGQPELVPPQELVSPYGPTKRQVIWAVTPLNNESGVSSVDVLKISDALVASVSEVHGIDALPLNRTLAVMSARGMGAVRSPRDAKALLETLGVDGLLVGTVTAYDPYDPPELGLALVLYTMDGSRAETVDTKSLTGAYSDQHAGPRTAFSDRPSATVIEHLSASNHEVLMHLKEFAQGRHDPQSALTWRRYTASMELYTQFAAYWMVRELLEQERGRIGGVAVVEKGEKESVTESGLVGNK